MNPKNNITHRHQVPLHVEEDCFSTPPNLNIKQSTPTAPKKRRTTNTANVKVDKSEFSGYTSQFKGYKCFFLKKENYVTIRFPSTQLCLTKSESLAIFKMPEILHDRLMKRIVEICEMQRTSASQVIVKPTKNDGTLFIKLSPCITYFWCHDDSYVEVQKTNLPIGSAFSGKVAIVLKGVKLNKEGTELSPMLSVMQIMVTEHAEREPMRLNKCILLDVNEEGNIDQETERLMSQLDY